MKKSTLFLGTATLGLCALLCGCSSADYDQNDLKIGLVLPLTGEYAEYGKQIERGVQVALDRIKIENSTATRIPRLLQADDAGRGDMAATAIRLLEREGAVMALVGYTSQEALAAKTPAAQLFFPVMAIGGTNSKITERNPFMMRSNFSDAQQAKALAYHIRFNRGMGRLGVMLNLDENVVYAHDLGRQTGQYFAEYGGRLVRSAGFRETDSDFKKPLKELIEHSPDVIFVPAYSACAGKIVKAARELGFAGLLIGSDAWAGDDFYKYCGDEIGDVAFSSNYSPAYDSEAQRVFIKAFRERYGYDPSDNEALGYDAMNMAFLASRDVRSRAEIPEKFKLLRGFAGTSGDIRATDDGGVSRNVFINTIIRGDDGKWQVKLHKTINANRITQPPPPVRKKQDSPWAM